MSNVQLLLCPMMREDLWRAKDPMREVKRGLALRVRPSVSSFMFECIGDCMPLIEKTYHVYKYLYLNIYSLFIIMI